MSWASTAAALVSRIQAVVPMAKVHPYIRNTRFDVNHEEFQAAYVSCFGQVQVVQITRSALRSRIPMICSPNKGHEFNVANWSIPSVKDYVVMFTPSGTVKTNGLPHSGGHYHLVVCGGLTTTAGTPPAGSQPTSLSYFQMSSVASPSTLSISPSGAVFVNDGLLQNGGVSVVRQTLATGVGALPPGPSTLGTNQNPSVSLARLEPEQAPPFIISKDKQVSVVLEASDGDGDPLYVSWSTNPASLGKFSSPTQSKMEWVANPSGTGKYRACWAWTPPEGAVAGDSVSLNYQVVDSRGGTATGSLSAPLKVVRKGRIAFARTLATGESVLATCASDGQGITYLTAPDYERAPGSPGFSPDYKRIAYYDYDVNTLAEELFVCNGDGSNSRRIDQSPDGYDYYGGRQGPCWSRDGSAIVACELLGGNMVRVDPVTGTRANLTAPVLDMDNTPDCSPVLIAGADRVVFTRFLDSTLTSAVCSVRLADGLDFRILAQDPNMDFSEPTFNPTGTKVLMTNMVFATDTFNLYTIDPMGGPRQPILSGLSVYIDIPQYSPDGSLIAFRVYDYDSDLDSLCITRSDGTHPDTGAPNSYKVLMTSWTVDQFSWSPSSSSLVCSATQMDEYSHLYVCDVLGSATPKLLLRAESEVEDFTPAWGGE